MTERLRFALVGCGTIATTHARALRKLQDRAELVACSDIVPTRAVALADEFGLRAVNYDVILAERDIDAVVVCTPSGLHAELGVPALLAGKHVVVEKPMDVTVAACDRLLAAQRTTGRHLGVISQTRFDMAAQRVKQAIDGGELGRLLAVDCKVPWYRTQDYYDADDWRGTWQLDGGGCLINQGVHTLDLLLWICGPVESAYAQARTAAHDRLEVEDLLCATLVFRSGALGSVLAATCVYPGFPSRLAVHGAEGSAVIEGGKLTLLVARGREPVGGERAGVPALDLATGGTRAATRAAEQNESGAVDPADVWGEGHRRQLLDFIKAVQTGRPPAIDGTQGRKVVELVTAIYRSADAGEVVKM